MNGNKKPVERYIKHEVQDLVYTWHSINGSINYHKFLQPHGKKVNDFTKHPIPFFNYFNY